MPPSSRSTSSAGLPWSHARIASRAGRVCSARIVPPGGPASGAVGAGNASDSAAAMSAQRAASGAGSRAMLARAVPQGLLVLALPDQAGQIEQRLANRSIGCKRVVEDDRGSFLEHALFGQDAGHGRASASRPRRCLHPQPSRSLPRRTAGRYRSPSLKRPRRKASAPRSARASDESEKTWRRDADLFMADTGLSGLNALPCPLSSDASSRPRRCAMASSGVGSWARGGAGEKRRAAG